jgi:hypothetical protein
MEVSVVSAPNTSPSDVSTAGCCFVSIVVVVVATTVVDVVLNVSVVDGVIVEAKNFCGCNT